MASSSADVAAATTVPTPAVSRENLPQASNQKVVIDAIQMKACNSRALLDVPADKEYFTDGVKFLKNCPLTSAFTINPVGIISHLQGLWFTAECAEAETSSVTIIHAIQVTIYGMENGTFNITANRLRKALGLPCRVKNTQWADLPTSEELDDFYSSIGYSKLVADSAVKSGDENSYSTSSDSEQGLQR